MPSLKTQIQLGRLSSYSIDKFIAPNASLLTGAIILDMSDFDAQSEHWVENYVLNSMLRAAWELPINSYVYNYLRRAIGAFREHGFARTETLLFIETDQQSSKKYTLALFHWEIFLGQSWHAYKTLQTCFLNGAKLYAKGENSALERLNKLYNQMKHFESRIKNAQIPEGATTPVWITNVGLESSDTRLTFTETKEILEEIATWANILQDPLSAQQKVEELKQDSFAGSK